MVVAVTAESPGRLVIVTRWWNGPQKRTAPVPLGPGKSRGRGRAWAVRQGMVRDGQREEGSRPSMRRHACVAALGFRTDKSTSRKSLAN